MLQQLTFSSKMIQSPANFHVMRMRNKSGAQTTGTGIGATPPGCGCGWLLGGRRMGVAPFPQDLAVAAAAAPCCLPVFSLSEQYERKTCRDLVALAKG